ncbi:MAG: glycine cleavage system aminomethyltransferase GcvT [Planctomycetota bacterium]|jgi:aminomethyltransferase|nr:MAG: glycine cleavage system aminomethyltransferase GcvT [Planctomycetota bacterium]RLS92489.1 MAG: glycine cleavage system aminomethyltransferase GcvT [Planctomycetota bacterium]
MTTEAAALKRTPFHALHLEHKARMVEYAGYEMPIVYGSILEEHRQCRASAGFFDVSHMGRLRFSGRHARKFLDHVCTRQVLGMQPGMVRYSLICNERGGCRDDVLIYCVDEDEYLMVCNASNRHKLLEHFASHKGDMAFKLGDETESTAMVAIQGPKAMELISRMSSTIPSMKRYRFMVKNLVVIKLLVSRTGYTGEDGVEVILPSSMAKLALGMVLKDMGAESSVVKPVGLAARDTLRMEAGMPLYGHEINEDLDPVSAGLDFGIKFDKGHTGGPDDERTGTFIGQDALRAIKAAGPTRRLVGLFIEGRRSPRQGMQVLSNGVAVGEVTSGCISPSLDRGIAMAYVPASMTEVGTAFELDLAGKGVTAAVVTKLPFVSNT